MTEMSLMKLITADGKEFIVDHKVIEMSATLKTIHETYDVPIVLPTISSEIMMKVVEYCNHHHHHHHADKKK